MAQINYDSNLADHPPLSERLFMESSAFSYVVSPSSGNRVGALSVASPGPLAAPGFCDSRASPLLTYGLSGGASSQRDRSSR